jgi:hypothetical protein
MSGYNLSNYILQTTKDKMSESQGQQELFNNVLGLTRDQLTKSMNLATELEALLMIERKKNQDLEAKLAELQAAKTDEKK